MSNENQIIIMDGDYTPANMRPSAIAEIEKAVDILNEAITRGDLMKVVNSDDTKFQLNKPFTIKHTYINKNNEKIYFADFNTPNSVWKLFPEFNFSKDKFLENYGCDVCTTIGADKIDNLCRFLVKLRDEFKCTTPPFNDYYFDEKYKPTVYVWVEYDLSIYRYLFSVTEIVGEECHIYSEVFEYYADDDNGIRIPLVYLSQHEVYGHIDDDYYDSTKYIAYAIKDNDGDFEIKNLEFSKENPEALSLMSIYVNPGRTEYIFKAAGRNDNYPYIDLRFYGKTINYESTTDLYLSSKYYTKKCIFISKEGVGNINEQ